MTAERARKGANSSRTSRRTNSRRTNNRLERLYKQNLRPCRVVGSLSRSSLPVLGFDFCCRVFSACGPGSHRATDEHMSSKRSLLNGLGPPVRRIHWNEKCQPGSAPIYGCLSLHGMYAFPVVIRIQERTRARYGTHTEFDHLAPRAL